jgi:hypothetical protein
VELASGKVLDVELYDVIKDPLGYNNLVADKKFKDIMVRHQHLLKKGWRNIVVK